MKFIIALLFLWMMTLARCQTFLDLLKSYGIGSKNIRTLLSPTRKEYDFIIVGSGSGGSTVANRLSENPNWKVLLLEAGQPEGFFNQIPVVTAEFQLNEYNWGYSVQPQDNACLSMNDRRCTWPTGKSLGGSSTINYMIHTRGNKLDYDEWAALGNYGWSYDEVLPYFRKSEKFKVPGYANSSYHGTNGYLCVEYSPYHSPLATEFLRASEQLGYEVLDYNGPRQIGFSYIQVNMEKGARCSASKAYLTVKRSNLDIVTHARVTKILIDNSKRAYGVQYVKKGSTNQIYASKEVIVSAGTIDSSKLLMLSGIGPREHLEELGINVIKDSRVGYNLYEHIGFLGLNFIVNQPVTLIESRLLKSPSQLLQYVLNRGGPVSIAGGAEALGFIRTRYAPDSRPDMELLFASAAFSSDNGRSLKPGHGLSNETYDTVFKPIENQDVFTIWPVLQNPRSHGRITLKSKNPYDAPIIQPNFFTDPLDVEVILEGIKHALTLTSREPFRAYATRVHDIKIPGCEYYDFGSDDYWRCAIRHMPSMMNHEIGTCKMGPESDPDAVVDPQLRVYGIKGLRVVDASIMPKLPVGHVNAGIYMIGEKAADMIKETWKGAF